jgi:nitrite reductase/ring-hydroxylating ferredoxin subunit/uncharacterized membrane protein
MRTPLPALAGRIEELRALDPLAKRVGDVAEGLIPPGPVKDALSGTWLGHALHPALTDVVVGSWTSAVVLDAVGGERAQEGADLLVGIGCLAAIPTAVTGLSDWLDTTGREWRMGFVHAAGNVAALAMYGASFVARRRGRRGLGVALGALGGATASFTAYLGGHLVFDRAVGVNQTATEHRPRKWTVALASDELSKRAPALGRAAGEEVLLYRDGERIYAIANRCSHRGGPLYKGEVDGLECTVTCPWHGSVFKLEDGSVRRGPATSPQPTYEAREHHGNIEVRATG